VSVARQTIRRLVTGNRLAEARESSSFTATSPGKEIQAMQLTELNYAVSAEPEPQEPSRRFDQQLAKWIGDLGNDLMWIGMLGDRRELRCLPNHSRPDENMSGWSELPAVMKLMPGLLDLACPGDAGNVILRTADALYVALCLKGQPRLILGIEPATSLAKLGFA
jgi:hypothetical protein